MKKNNPRIIAILAVVKCATLPWSDEHISDAWLPVHIYDQLVKYPVII